MTKRFASMAYRGKTTKKEVKMGRVGPLPDVPRTRVKAHVRRQDPTYGKPQ